MAKKVTGNHAHSGLCSLSKRQGSGSEEGIIIIRKQHIFAMPLSANRLIREHSQVVHNFSLRLGWQKVKSVKIRVKSKK